jgi:hypothetical protein
MSRQCARQTRWALTASLATAALLITPGTAGARAARAQAPPCQPWTSTLPPSPGAGGNEFVGVSALSACDVWAVGNYQTVSGGPLLNLAEHWNGTAWKVVPTPNPSGTVTEMDLAGVAATSASNAWAVGTYNTSTSQNIIIERWNGTAWKLVPSPDPGPEPFLFGVAAASASDAWAVGSYDAGASQNTMIAHWNGAAWKLVPSPSPGSSASFLRAVAATSASNVWAAGDSSSGGPSQVFAIHCC